METVDDLGRYRPLNLEMEFDHIPLGWTVSKNPMTDTQSVAAGYTILEENSCRPLECGVRLLAVHRSTRLLGVMVIYDPPKSLMSIWMVSLYVLHHILIYLFFQLLVLKVLQRCLVRVVAWPHAELVERYFSELSIRSAHVAEKSI